MVSLRSKVVWLAIASIAGLGGAWLARELHSSEPQLASGTWFPQPRAIGEFKLTDQGGRALTRSSLSGRPTLVFFGFTHCPDVCPTTLATVAQARKTAGLDDLRVLLISVDPARDTPAVLEKYVGAFDPAFTGATGSQEEINRITKEFGVAVQRVEMSGADYSMDHSAAVFILDTRAQIAGVFTPPFEASTMAEDLRRIAPALES